MFNLGAGDKLEGIAGTANEVSYHISGVDGSTLIEASGFLGNAQTDLHDATAATRIYSVVLHNKDSSAITVTLQKDPSDAGTLYIFFSLSLGAGYQLFFDGQRCTVLDASGNVQTLPGLHGVKHKTGGADPFLADPGAIGGDTPAPGAFTTIAASGDITLTGSDLIIGTDGQGIDFSKVAGGEATGSLLRDYEEGIHVATLVCSTADGYTLAAGSDTLAYTKIGRLVHLQGELEVTGEDGTPNGQLRISLPFTVEALAEAADTCVTKISISGHGGTIVNGAEARAGGGVTYMSLVQTLDDGTQASITDATVDTAFYIVLSVFFTTAS